MDFLKGLSTQCPTCFLNDLIIPSVQPVNYAFESIRSPGLEIRDSILEYIKEVDAADTFKLEINN